MSGLPTITIPLDERTYRWLRALQSDALSAATDSHGWTQERATAAWPLERVAHMAMGIGLARLSGGQSLIGLAPNPDEVYLDGSLVASSDLIS